ncbi:MAG: hypothetical protein R3C44_01240 [Chloroflexota bacterium]
MTTLDDLLDYIFEGQQPPFYPEFEDWVRDSRRYRAFATTYRDKIRAKLRNIRDEDSLNDLRAELETAALLLRDKQFALEYEKHAAAKQRSPDFTVTYKTHTPFNVEVRRIRSLELGDDDGVAYSSKLMTVLCDKVGQTAPGIINLLWLVADDRMGEDDLLQAVTALRQLAERKDEEFFTRRGFKNSADFLKQYRQLSGIVIPQSGEDILWLNPIARHAVPTGIVAALHRLDTG